jgi:hypothetical protein
VRISPAGLRAATTRVGLPAWFIAVDLLWVLNPEAFAIDARHYQRAANAWLEGGNPWMVMEAGVPFAAAPPTLLFYLPTSLLPLELSVLLWMAAGLAASAWMVRRLGLPVWWLLFPPLAHALWNGNCQSIVVALLVAGGVFSAIGAVGLKLYAIVPLVARPRHLLVCGAVLAVTLAILPWSQYTEHRSVAERMLLGSWGGGAWRFPIILAPTLLALWVLRRRGAEWLLIPALWPASQFYYVSTAMPALVGRPLLAAALALPAPLAGALATIGLAALVVWQSRTPAVPTNEAGPATGPATGSP